MRKKAKRRCMLIILLFVALISAGFIAQPLIQLSNSVSSDKHQADHLPFGQVDDASRLNQTNVSEVWELPADDEQAERQLAELLKRARKDGLKVSIAGARHSMGGHTIYPGGIAINTTQWNHMELDDKRDILKVQAGALWQDILPYLNKRGKSVAIMQSNNSFSVGGSISVNCHGWQYDRPPIASSVESFRIMLADGSIKHCSREQNQELFSLALGGYGLFGIILDVELRVVANETYRLEQHIVPVNKSLGTFDNKIKNKPGLEMVYARMNIVPENLLGEVILNAFYRIPPGEGGPDTTNKELIEPGLIELRRAVFRGSAESDFGKKLRWNAETKLGSILFDWYNDQNELQLQNKTKVRSAVKYRVKEDCVDEFLNAVMTPSEIPMKIRKTIIQTDEQEFYELGIAGLEEKIEMEGEEVKWLDTVEHLLEFVGDSRTDACSGVVNMWNNPKFLEG